ncbi:uncharacterized protein K452DRAFT_48476 [Aplosporella prunicola CBS 121167]|uniref:Uncharacterized protein n=1 Tax=Aplosporella prunicola CBS 121167 TaxID=1176127 RepID=A0A6A6B993_9PEZI|nr:uncharacterized protein K452DRAFT_48476 [Aplosporella prunicola CBS 121167]KAF2140576.1 hypothetical protein K452DRAFT_48476 [Aplosporella prunicola CBS 121167]
MGADFFCTLHCTGLSMFLIVSSFFICGAKIRRELVVVVVVVRRRAERRFFRFRFHSVRAGWLGGLSGLAALLLPTYYLLLLFTTYLVTTYLLSFILYWPLLSPSQPRSTFFCFAFCFAFCFCFF